MQDTSKLTRRCAYLRMHLATLLFGVSGLLGKICQASALTLVLGRSIFAVAALALILLLRKEKFSLLKTSNLLWLILSGALLSLHFVTFFQGIKMGGVAVGTLGFACFPAFTALLECLIFHEKLGLNEFIALLLVILGLFLLNPNLNWANATTQGLGVGVLSALIYAFCALMNRKISKQISATSACFLQNLVILFLLWPLSYANLAKISALDWFCVTFLGIFCTAIAYTLYVGSLRAIPARQAALIISLEPPYTIFLAWLLGQENLSLTTILGGISILAAVVCIQTRRH
ncbi:MAG: DMT family transporter [Desulfovibrionaceae bacterium]|nr:DMT family transporter [Desulfovibrionaceae bacterium]